MKADRLDFLEGNRPRHAMESVQRHHRGLRPCHVFIGVTRELGRSNCLLVQIRLGVPYPNSRRLSRKPRHSSESVVLETQKKKGRQGIMEGK